MRRFTGAALAAAVLLAATTQPAYAGIVFQGTNGNLSAKATFTVSGNNLDITLENTASADALVQADILTAIFFSISTNNALTLQSATASGIYQQNSTQNTNANGTLDPLAVANLAAPGSTNGGPGSFQGGWQFRENLGGLGSGLNQTRGLGTNGLNIFNGNQVKDVDNEDYALTSAGDNVATSQAQQLFNHPLIKNSISFSLSGLPGGFSESNISNVRFQYGTNLSSEPSITVQTGNVPLAVPEPSSLLLCLLAAGSATGYAGWRRRSRGSN